MQEDAPIIDVPIDDAQHDTLELGTYANALSQFILRAATPITIGIQGDWGCGKSSMMYLIQQSIQAQRDNIHTMWFNTWQFSQFNMGDNLTISLLSRFIDEMESLTQTTTDGDSGESTPSEAKKTLRKLAVWTIAGAMELVGVNKIAGKMIENDEEPEIKKEPSEYIGQLKGQLTGLVAEKAQQLDRIVVFIDDIDRLMPEKAVDLLEALKLFLDIKGCVFVLACDYQVIAQGLKQKFNLSENDLKGKSFFDKLIQVPFNMPVSQYNAQGFLTTMLDEHIGITYTAKEDKEKDAALYLKLVTNSVGFNPRTVKRLFNNLLLLKFVLEAKDVLKSDNVAQVNEKMRILFATLCLQHTFGTLYNHLLSYLQELGEPENLTKEDVTETNEFFTSLKNPATFKQQEGEFAEINVGDAYKLANFMGVFFDAIQLKSDTSKNAAETLNLGEIATLNSILSFSVVVSVPEKSGQPVPAPKWTGYWFVNVGEGDYRTWADNRKYSFMSAGHGKRHSSALKRLSVGDKIYAYLKGRGYVGFGEITQSAVMIKDFIVSEQNKPLLALDLTAKRAGDDIDNEELSEWAVAVNWLNSVPESEAKTFSGVFANQNAVCKLKHEATLRFVQEHLGK